MKFDDYANVLLRYWDGYYTYLHARLVPGRSYFHNRDLEATYPTLAIATDCGTHFVFELFGAVAAPKPLKLIKGRCSSIDKYLFQHVNDDAVSAFQIASRNNTFSHLTIGSEMTDDNRRRFPWVAKYGSRITMDVSDHTSIRFHPTSESTMIFHCCLTASVGNIFRAKDVLNMHVTRCGTPESEVRRSLPQFDRNNFNADALGWREKNAPVDMNLISQLQSLYLTYSLRETTIGQFLNENNELLKLYFQSDDVICEAEFDWVEHAGKKPSKGSIRPDILVRRADGCYDIVDLKTALLDTPSLTGADDARRTFIHYVYKGQAQLAHYRSYFTYPANAAHALERHGVTVRDPRLTLVVGHFENADPEEVAQAQLCSDIGIVDYDTFLSQIMRIAGVGFGRENKI